jgi:pimeloyl-ACP methyl ester carboxylesterase
VVGAAVVLVCVATVSCRGDGALDSSAEVRPSASTVELTATSEFSIDRRPPGHGCVTTADQASATEFHTTDDVAIGGLMMGQGSAAVVMMHELGATLCNWLPVGRRLRDEGYRVLLLDSRGNGSSAYPEPGAAYDWNLDLHAAVDHLRNLGIDSLVLVGGSYGATIVSYTAPELEPPPAGVVNVSGGTGYRMRQVPDVADRLTMPLLFIAGSGDGSATPGARTVLDAAPSADETLVVLPTRGHATELFNGTTATEAMTALLAFIRRVAPIS